MKYRNGFVTNSSSSSFVVAFPRDPKDANDVREILFKGMDHFVYDDQRLPIMQVAEYIWESMQRPESKDEATINAHMGSLPFSSDQFMGVDGEIDYDAYDTMCTKYKEIMAKNWKAKHLGSSLYYFHFADDSGQALYEHGGVFENVPYIRESHH